MRQIFLLILICVHTMYVSAQIKGIVYSDINNNSIFDSNDSILENASIEVLDNSEILYASVLTNLDGEYFIDDLPEGNYILTVCSVDCVCSSLPFFVPANGELSIIDIPLKCSFTNLALKLTLAPGQPNYFAVGDLVTFDISVYNQGTAEVAIADIINYIPNGLALNDGKWSMLSDQIAFTQITKPISPGAARTLSIDLYVKDNSFCSISNIAEVVYQEDNNSQSDYFAFNDLVLDKKINNAIGDEDDQDIETIQIDCANCPALLNLGNASLQSGLYVAGSAIRSSGNVPSDNSVNLQAGECIELGDVDNDFEVNLNANFHAYIAPCGCSIESPDFLLVNDVDIDKNLIFLSWNAVDGASQYEIAYYVDEENAGSFFTAKNNISLTLDTSGLNHTFTVLSVCENGDTKQGASIGYTLSQECSTCLPPQKFDVSFTEKEQITLTTDLPKKGNLYKYEFFDKKGERILDAKREPLQFFSKTDKEIINQKQFTGNVFPDVFEVGLSVVCEKGNAARPVLVESCHLFAVIIMTEEDVATREYYCNRIENETLFNISRIRCNHLFGTPHQYYNHHCQ